MKYIATLAGAAGLALIGAGAFAQHTGHGGHSPAAGHSGHSGHAGHAGHSSPAGADNDATKAFRAANDKMHKDMDIAFSGDADADFARGMIPHHEGAVDMAKIVLKYGKDPELRKLAEEVVRTQEAEVKFMRAWLARRGLK